jgi:hypothetical protein
MIGLRLTLTCLAALAASLGMPSAQEQKTESPTALLSPAPNKGSSTDLAKPNTNHALLAELVGTWAYKLNIRMGKDRWITTDGVVVRKPIMDGRFFMADFDVPMLPGAGGKLEKVNFAGKSIEAYDNVKQKFVSIWIDSASTGVTVFEGTYDPTSRSFTYRSETEPQPGRITKVRETVTIADGNHYSLAWFEEHGGHEIKTVEINYTRKS